MANNIDWGQGAKNNNIGWGQGAVNNNISWGAVHSESWSGDAEIIGGIYESVINFITRVTDDGGEFQAKQCLINTLINI